MKNSKSILVAGATGQQGGSVVDALLTAGFQVRGLTRNPASEKSRALHTRGVEMVRGDLTDFVSIKKALDGMDGFYFMTTFFEAGISEEIRQGILAAEAAKHAGTKHIVFSSVSDADRNTGVPHFDSKFKVEQHLQRLGIPHTIVAPTFFYENSLSFFMLPSLQNGTLAIPLPADTLLKSISVKNIGDFVSLVFSDRDRFLGKRINITGDERSGREYANALTFMSNTSITYTELPINTVRAMNNDVALMYEWFIKAGFSPEPYDLRRRYPEVPWLSFAKWAENQNWTILKKRERLASVGSYS